MNPLSSGFVVIAEVAKFRCPYERGELGQLMPELQSNSGVLMNPLSSGFVVIAEVAKLVYALDLGSSGATRESSSLSFRTILSNYKETYSLSYCLAPR